MPDRSRVTLSRLEMWNFKRFYGAHSLDLRPDPSTGKPIVLIGGDNGRGKTSIHEAIYYALYEDDELPGINTRPNYIRAVSDRLNRRALDEGAGEFGVALELAIKESGPERRFRIERKWDVDVGVRKVTGSNLYVYENERLIDWIDPEDPHAVRQFVRNIFPPRIAPFFFFDGERIQDFAESANHEQRLVDAIEDILHINVYRQLRKDLGTYVADTIERDEVKKVDSGDYFKLLEDAERIETELEEKKDRKAEIDREIEELSVERKRASDELRRIASPHASQRDQLLIDQERIERELASIKNEIDHAFALVPIGLAGPLCKQLSETLLKERLGVRSAESVRELRQKLTEVIDRVLAPPPPDSTTHPKLTEAQTEYLRKRFKGVAEEVFGLDEGGQPADPVHDIGEGERSRILDRLGQVASALTLLRDAVDRRERLAQEQRDVQLKLQSTSDDPLVAKVLEKKQQVDEKLGELNDEQNRLLSDIQRLEADFASRRRQIEDRQKEREASTEAKRVVMLARKAQTALDEFIRKLHPEKLHALETNFNSMYERLRKPEDPVKSISVDEKTWEVVLSDEKGRPLERRVFSAGMKEMFALSLLWALARASGRELPIVIDTPLGRLDSKNRAALCRHYFPSAGHQVVLLSTDREVDQEWFSVLRPYVARQYRLDYDSETDSTVIRPGYFF